MATYKTMSSLKTALQKSLVPATNTMAKKVMEKVDERVIDYYLDYTPKVYQRTGLMSSVPQKTDASLSGDTANAKVYADLSLRYSTGTWTMEQVWSSANNYEHGGIKPTPGVAVWDEPMEESANNSRNMWRESLQSAGISVT